MTIFLWILCIVFGVLGSIFVGIYYYQHPIGSRVSNCTGSMGDGCMMLIGWILLAVSAACGYFAYTW